MSLTQTRSSHKIKILNSKRRIRNSNNNNATMKASSLALSVLTAAGPIVGTAAQQQHGEAAAQYKKMAALRGVSASSTIGNSGIADEAAAIAKCTPLTDKVGCNANDSCTWCESGATGNACYPSMLTKELPSAVFKCDGKEEASVLKKEDKTKKATNLNVQTFNLKEGVTLTMSAGEVDKDFCDASSPVSLAGYMSGE